MNPPELRSQLTVLGGNIRKARRGADLSQESLAEMAELHRTYICDIERGTRNITVRSLLLIGHALGVTVSKLTEGLELGCVTETSDTDKQKPGENRARTRSKGHYGILANQSAQATQIRANS